jgi:hypothetical protein
MADENNTIRTRVELDSTQAQIEIAKLNAKASDSTKTLEDRLEAKNKEVKLQNELSKKTISNLEKEVKSLTGVTGKEKELERAISKLNNERVRSTKVSERNIKQQNKLTQSLGKSKKSIGGLGAAFGGLGSSVGGMIPILGKLKIALISTGIGALVVAIGGMIALMSEAVKKGAEFSKGLSGLKAVADASAEEISTLGKQAKQLGSTTAFTATQVVQLQTELAKLGFEVSEIGNATPAILDLAASLDVDLASAAKLSGGLVRAFGLDASEAQRVVDVMAASASGSAQDFGSMVESFKLAAPTAKAMGLSVEETGAILGTLSDSMIKGSLAGTGFSTVLIKLKENGLTLEEGLEQVRGSSDKMGTSLDLVGKIGAKSLLTLANSGEGLEKLRKGLADTKEGARGAAREMAEIKLDNLDGDITKLGSAWEGFLLGLEDGSGVLNNLARGAVTLLTDSITGLQKALNFISFTWTDGWDGIKNYTNASVDILVGYFDKFGSNIKIFANEALLSIADIPIIGKGVDRAKVEKNLAEAEGYLKASNERIRKGTELYNKQVAMDETFWIRAKANQLEKENQIAFAKSQKLLEKQDAEKEKKAKELSDKEKARINKELEEARAKEAALIEIKKTAIASKKLAGDETFELQKSLIDRQMAYELSALQLNEEQKQAIKDKFALKQEELKVAKDEKDEEERLSEEQVQIELDELAIEKLYEKGERTLEAELELLERKRLQDVSVAGLSASEIQLINEKASFEKQKLKDKENKYTFKSDKAALDAGIGMAAEEFGVAQEVAIAKMIMAAPEAIGNVWKNASKKLTLPQIALHGSVGTAMVVAPIVKGLADIKKARFGKKKGGSGGGGASISNSSGGGITSSAVTDISANNASRLGIDTSLGTNAESSAANRIAGGSCSNVVFSEARYGDFQRQVGFREERSSMD